MVFFFLVTDVGFDFHGGLLSEKVQFYIICPGKGFGVAALLLCYYWVILNLIFINKIT